MLKKVEIEKYKCFDALKLDIGKITLLVGTNSSGKSSVVQALRLISQNLVPSENSPLNGDLIKVGNFSEARNFTLNAKEFTLKAFSDDGNISCKFFGDTPEDVQVAMSSQKLGKILNPKNGHFRYLSEDRIGAKDAYERNFSSTTDFGNDGQWVVDYLQKKGTNPVIVKLKRDLTSETLETQVNYWLRYILRTKIQTESIERADSVLASYSHETNLAQEMRPKNVGSGISYMLGILVICLSAKEGDIISIENPEIHLHPIAQSKLTEFFLFIANAGIQLIIETHSDHIYNGLRVGIAKKEILPMDMSINYFLIADDKLIAQHHKVSINDKGKVENHVAGLFDQFSLDLDSLLGLDKWMP